MAATTALEAVSPHHLVMPDIVVPSGWREKLEEIAGGRRQSWLVAGLVAALVLGALALSGRDAPARVAPPATAGAASPAPLSPSPSAGAPVGSIFVHVAGAVRTPGLYELAQGARVADAIEAAGGPRPKADLDLLNLAEPLVDGAKVDVLRRGEAPAPAATAASPGPAGESPSGTEVVDVNTADQAALESIPGIGPAKAAAILDYRSQIGRFDSFEQLLEVSGIGPATLESIRPYIALQ